MTSQDMIIEFKVLLDKVDSQAYPELYAEQIYIFLNKAIDELVNRARKDYEETQVISDLIKPLVKTGYITGSVVSGNSNVYQFPVTSVVTTEGGVTGMSYRFFLRAQAKVTLGAVSRYVKTKWTEIDDLDPKLEDPFNKPVVNEVPVAFEANSIFAYKDTDFEVTHIRVTFVEDPAVVDDSTNCNLPVFAHKTIVDRAVSIALSVVESSRKQ